MTLIDWRLSDNIHWLQHMMADSNDMSLLHEQQGAMINTEGAARNLNGDVDDEDVENVNTNYYLNLTFFFYYLFLYYLYYAVEC